MGPEKEPYTSCVPRKIFNSAPCEDRDSIDHTLMAWNLLDPLWLDVDDPKFGVCAEVGRFVRVGFVDDLPFIAFSKRYKDAPHPFYQAVYREGVSLDKRLADNMDTCIIK